MVVVSITQLNCFAYNILLLSAHTITLDRWHTTYFREERRERRNLISFIVMPSCPSWNVVLHFDNLSHWDVISDNAPWATCTSRVLVCLYERMSQHCHCHCLPSTSSDTSHAMVIVVALAAKVRGYSMLNDCPSVHLSDCPSLCWMMAWMKGCIRIWLRVLVSNDEPFWVTVSARLMRKAAILCSVQSLLIEWQDYWSSLEKYLCAL